MRMKKLFFNVLLIVSLVIFSGCSSKSSQKVANTPAAEKFIKLIVGSECYKAEITDNNILIIGIDAVNTNSNYDALVSQFLSEAKSEGVEGLKGCFIVDSNTAEFQQGAVVGDRLGKAFN